MKQEWDTVRDILKARLSKHEFEQWFANARPLEFSDTRLELAVDDDFSMKWIRSNYLELLKDILWELYGKHLGIEVSVNRHTPQHAQQHDNTSRTWGLTGRYTFDRFVAGPSNELALTVAKQAADLDASAFNPLFIHAGVGMGKTHLLQAIAHQVLAQGRFRALYVSAETLVNEVMNGVKNHDLNAVRRKYRGETDILIVDDIQFIARYPKANFVQSEFFHTFNELHGSGRRIVLSSDMPPGELPQLEERLRSRFEWGLVVEIEPPDRDTRLRIVQEKIRREGIDLDPDVIGLIVDRFTGSVREIEGAVNKLTAYTLVRHVKVDLTTARQLLRRNLGGHGKQLTLDTVANAVAQQFDIPVAELRGRSRQRKVVLARHVAYLVSRDTMDAPLVDIGRFYGNRNHATVISGLRSITGKIKTEPELERAVRLMEERLAR